jgi:hypothetical protein
VKVYVVESGDYEQRGVVLVAASVEAAFAAVKAIYGAPYRVHWQQADAETLVGDFEAIDGYSTQHTAYYDVTEYEVEVGKAEKT